MRRTFFYLLIVCQTMTIAAQKKAPKWLDKATKAIFTLEVTTDNGTTKTGSGFFIGENGEAVAAYALFINATKAVVTTPSGEQLNVSQILGADDLYGVIRFKVAVPKKTVFLPVALSSPATGAIAYLPPATQGKNLTEGAITEITKINSSYDYFKVEMPLPASQEGYPLLNEAGEVFALTQPDAAGQGNTYGISIAYIQSLQLSGTDMLKRTYTDIGIRKAWSSDIEEAQIALILYSSQQDAPTYLATLNDFIETFPTSADGYNSRASHYAYRRSELAATEAEQLHLLDLAWNDLESAAKYTANKGEGFYNKAKLIFGIAATDSTLQYKDWNIETASALIQQAISADDTPGYRQLEGDIAFFNNDFQSAYRSYAIVNLSPTASGASYYLAAKCLQQIPGSNMMEIITLMDNAIEKSPANEAVEYILESVELKMQVGLYEEAVKGYDKYYATTAGNVNDGFYYFREQAKFRNSDFEGALNDINTAILMNENNAIYYAERASVYLRLQDLPKAQENAEKAIALAPDFASAYRILGVSLVRQEKKQEACVQLLKAKELGDPVVDKLIKEHACQKN